MQAVQEIGKRIAQALGIEFYDRDLVDKVVEQIGVDRDLVKKADAGSNVLYSFETQYGLTVCKSDKPCYL